MYDATTPLPSYFIGKRNFGFTFELIQSKVYATGKIRGYSFMSSLSTWTGATM
jgi:hypothetical protein